MDNWPFFFISSTSKYNIVSTAEYSLSQYREILLCKAFVDWLRPYPHHQPRNRYIEYHPTLYLMGLVEFGHGILRLLHGSQNTPCASDLKYSSRCSCETGYICYCIWPPLVEVLGLGLGLGNYWFKQIYKTRLLTVLNVTSRTYLHYIKLALHTMSFLKHFVQWRFLLFRNYYSIYNETHFSSRNALICWFQIK